MHRLLQGKVFFVRMVTTEQKHKRQNNFSFHNTRHCCEKIIHVACHYLVFFFLCFSLYRAALHHTKVDKISTCLFVASGSLMQSRWVWDLLENLSLPVPPLKWTLDLLSCSWCGSTKSICVASQLCRPIQWRTKPGAGQTRQCGFCHGFDLFSL